MTVITKAFVRAAQIRAKALGLSEHPVVVIDHPIASMNEAQIKQLAKSSVNEIAAGLST